MEGVLHDRKDRKDIKDKMIVRFFLIVIAERLFILVRYKEYNTCSSIGKLIFGKFRICIANLLNIQDLRRYFCLLLVFE
jgi:hypothetical protein